MIAVGSRIMASSQTFSEMWLSPAQTDQGRRNRYDTADDEYQVMTVSALYRLTGPETAMYAP